MRSAAGMSACTGCWEQQPRECWVSRLGPTLALPPPPASVWSTGEAPCPVRASTACTAFPGCPHLGSEPCGSQGLSAQSLRRVNASQGASPGRGAVWPLCTECERRSQGWAGQAGTEAQGTVGTWPVAAAGTPRAQGRPRRPGRASPSRAEPCLLGTPCPAVWPSFAVLSAPTGAPCGSLPGWIYGGVFGGRTEAWGGDITGKSQAHAATQGGPPQLRGRERWPGAGVWEQRNLAPPSPWLLSPPSLGDFDSTEKGAPTAGNLPACLQHSPSRSRAPTRTAWEAPGARAGTASPRPRRQLASISRGACCGRPWHWPRPPPTLSPDPVLSRWATHCPCRSPACLPHTSVRRTRQIWGTVTGAALLCPPALSAGQGSSLR